MPGLFGSSDFGSASGRVWARGVADQSLAGGIVVCMGGGGEAGLLLDGLFSIVYI